MYVCTYVMSVFMYVCMYICTCNVCPVNNDAHSFSVDRENPLAKQYLL
jgi:hypothetical protein